MSLFEPFRRHRGVAAPLPLDNVDTDAIFPAAWIQKMDIDYADSLFASWRFLDGRSRENPDFVLNRAPFRRASILVAGHNFGCGSSREHAVWALKAWGFRAVIASSFGDIFHDNCFNNGLLPVTLAPPDLAALRDAVAASEGEGAGKETLVDLEAEQVSAPDGRSFAFRTDPARREGLLQGLDEIGRTLAEATAIESFQERDRARRPWIWTAVTAGYGTPNEKNREDAR